MHYCVLGCLAKQGEPWRIEIKYLEAVFVTSQ